VQQSMLIAKDALKKSISKKIRSLAHKLQNRVVIQKTENPLRVLKHLRRKRRKLRNKRKR
jgi:hypothetical protein